MLKRFYVIFVLLLCFSTVSYAQQLNVGVSRRQFNDHTVADAVLMAPEWNHVIFYGQTTFSTIKWPELYAAGEIPIINQPRFYIGFDNGLGWASTLQGKAEYGKGQYFTGLTTWIPIIGSFGTYGMYSYTPKFKTNTLQIGLFKQVF